MKKIANGVYIENNFPGVILGAIELPKGILMIDSPPRPDDGRAWQSSLRELKGGQDRILINLDSHPDRTLGTRVMDSAVLAHVDTAEIFKKRPAIFKANNMDSGAEWESCSGLSGIRWYHPTMVFSDKTELHWGGTQVIVEHHPGPEEGASWVVLPELSIAFVGDAVMLKQPPFLANANIPAWIDTLDLLQ
ncbi:MAG: hypothetical protein N2D54_03385 [Chloroflexota bacterium]